MRGARYWALAGSVGLAVSFTAAIAGTAVAKPVAGPGRFALHGSMTPASERSHPAGNVAAKTAINFDLSLALRNAAGAKAFVREVSKPGSKQFHKYLTDAKWIAKFGPTSASISAAQAWLRHQGFTVGALPKTHLFVPASGTAAQVERAFGVQLGYFHVNGHKVYLAKGTATMPGSLSGMVSGVVGLNEVINTTSLTSQGHSAKAAKPNQEPTPPTGFRNPQPCTHSFNSTPDTNDAASLYAPFTSPQDYDICGYVPRQLRSAYGLAASIKGGDDGSGIAVGIVDAYDSPTLLADSQRYFNQNDPGNPLTSGPSGQFFNFEPATVDDEAECGGSGWRAEQSLDVQAVHTMAPGATILYVGAQDCLDSGLLAALSTAITSGVSVVSDSWGSVAGDLLEDPATKTSFDNTFMLADATGVSVLFSSGDDGDNFVVSGTTAPDYPPASPFITAVGGTTLKINAAGHKAHEYGWSVAKQSMCLGVSTTNCGSATAPAVPLTWQAGGGGGSSFAYTQPFYQAGVVPAALALRNQALFGNTPVRVEPDVSMDADAQSGLLIGLTQAFPGGNHYGQFKEGGTSLASPLFAGVIADADQAAGGTLGFLNPELYKAWAATPGAFNDIQAVTHPNLNGVIRVDFVNSVDATGGFNISIRAIGYAGPETYCDGTGNCATRPVTITAAPGFDGLTGLGSPGRRFIAAMSGF